MENNTEKIRKEELFILFINNNRIKYSFNRYDYVIQLNYIICPVKNIFILIYLIKIFMVCIAYAYGNF